jgi:hypothetical protein
LAWTFEEKPKVHLKRRSSTREQEQQWSLTYERLADCEKMLEIARMI